MGLKNADLYSRLVPPIDWTHDWLYISFHWRCRFNILITCPLILSIIRSWTVEKEYWFAFFSFTLEFTNLHLVFFECQLEVSRSIPTLKHTTELSCFHNASKIHIPEPNLQCYVSGKYLPLLRFPVFGGPWSEQADFSRNHLWGIGVNHITEAYHWSVKMTGQ